MVAAKTPSARWVDLNADLGEGGAHDAELLAIVTSANVCSGAYAGGAALTTATMAAAAAQGIRLGAHVGYPDREGFGRRPMRLSAAALRESLDRQVGACRTAAHRAGGRLDYLKPHGALYHAAVEPSVAAEVLLACARASELALLHQPGTALASAASAVGVVCHVEGFADRRYLPNGRLVPRGEPEALVLDPGEVARQAVRLVRDGVGAYAVHSLCLHGDQAEARANATRVRDILLREGYALRTPNFPR